MAENKKWGQTVLGWFIVQDESAQGESGGDFGSPTIDEGLVEGVSSDAVPHADSALAEMPQVFEKEIPAAPGGVVDFEAVFEAAGITSEDRERVVKAVELLHSLPAGTDPTVKKQIVGASLKAFGVQIDKIIETGVQEIEALEGYIRAGATDTTKLMDESEQRIKRLEQEIADIRVIMQQRVTEQQGVMKHCNEKKLEVQQILEFFGQDAVARVVRESPKLHEPVPAK